MEDWKSILIMIAVIVIWVVMMKVVLPRAGVPT